MMTDTQKQCLLAFLGYYPAQEIDGQWGEKSAAAAKKFQAAYGLESDGVFGTLTQERIRRVIGEEEEPVSQGDDWWDTIEFFTREEFKCKCGGRYCGGYPAQMQQEVVQVADRARKYFGRPGYVVSGLRCQQHNANQGGVVKSQHMYGEAIDLRIEGVSGDELLSYVRQQPEIRYAYKINSTNVHFDIPKGAR